MVPVENLSFFNFLVMGAFYLKPESAAVTFT
jgi:hypothetical protein